MNLNQTWRWFGPNDTTTLQDVKQTGATGIVTALHHLQIGEIWTKQEILARKKQIEDSGLCWSVAESIPVHEDIKRQSDDYIKWIDHYKRSIRNLGECGIPVLCYNFMPVLDWTRTDINYPMPDGSTALRFDEVAFAAFDLFILNREGADQEFSKELVKKAESYLQTLNSDDKSLLTQTILAGLPGSEYGYTLEEFREILKSYNGISTADLKDHLKFFLREIVPEAEKANLRLAIHPDDPPFSLFGLPRVVSTENDLTDIIKAADSISNGWTLCTGSFGANPFNDLTGMVQRLGQRINFIHLRNIKIESGKTFHEADHLNGDVDMAGVMEELLKEMKHRLEIGRPDFQVPMRPDHGHNMLSDLHTNRYPGYSCIGRMRGLAELRGLETGIKKRMS